jgi:hypothetical protein
LAALAALAGVGCGHLEPAPSESSTEGHATGSGSPSGTATGTSSRGATGSTGSTSSTHGSSTSTAAARGDVLQFHTNPSRDGVYVDPGMTKSTAAGLTLDATFKPTITGSVYAQPLYAASGVMGKPTLVVATEENHVIALDPTGTGTAFWDQTFGTPVTNVGSTLGCGNIDPLGITGTPIIDPSSHAIYFDAMTLTGGAPKHMIHAIAMDTGAELAGWPVSPESVSGFASKSENQRAALQLLDGVVYAAYGGHNGDCGSYAGWVIGVPVANPSHIAGWSIGSVRAGVSRGGIWGVGGIPTDGTSLFVSTGNTLNAGNVWSGGEAVLRLTPPTPTFGNASGDAFYPVDWVNYDANDSDLGGANPLVFDMPGAPVQHLVAAFGKDGILYLLNRDNLGGAGGALSMQPVASDTGPAYYGALNAGAAVYTTSQGTYIAFHANGNAPGIQIMGCPSGQTGGNLGVARITAGSPPTAAVVWCAAEMGLGSPMVTTASNGDVVVWDANRRLYGYDGDTGTKVFDGTASPLPALMHYFNSPIDAAGTMVVATLGPTATVAVFR